MFCRENILLINEHVRRSIERENEYKSNKNTMNNKIFENVNKYHEYFHQTPIRDVNITVPAIMSPDVILNKKLVEMRKENPQNRDERVRERKIQDEDYTKIINRTKSEKETNRILYKGFLDYQIVIFFFKF